MQIEELVSAQRAFFNTGATKDAAFRRRALAALRQAVTAREADICAALKEDLHKSPFESYMCETGLVLSELTYMEKHLNRLMRARRAKTPLAQFAPATSRVLKELVESCFAPDHIAVVEGGRAENEALLEQKFDYIFFTGSVAVGRLVMEKAARWLTPVTLELGGKSPCIIDQTADLPLAAKRLAFGKYLNAGQTCVAPDYVLVHRDVHDGLLALLAGEIAAFYGSDPLACPDYGRIVNEKHFHRLMGLMDSGRVVCGGTGSAETLQIAPTVLADVSPDSPVMSEEIFGPVLPVLAYESLDEAVAFVNARPKPLALYLFTTDKAAERRVLRDCSFGGGCINDTIIHLATSDMGFGGVGESGMGSYHGKLSFDTFTHYKSIVKKSNRLDLPVRYQPYTKEKERMLRRVLK